MINKPHFIYLLLLGAFMSNQSVSAEALLPTLDFSKSEKGEAFPAGTASHQKQINKMSFMHPAPTINKSQQLDFMVGKGLFRKLWVSSPASTKASDGLGPLYNARSCATCHIKNGRGHPPQQGDNSVSIFLRLSIPPQNDSDKALLASNQVTFFPDPIYGRQLQTFAVQGLSAEGKLHVTYKELSVRLKDGEIVTLQQPTYNITDLGYGELHPDIMTSPRVAPPMLGLGLLEAISEKDLLSLADEYDSNGDGISGKPNKVWSKKDKKVMLGRFGYKAGIAILDEQNQDAFSGDLGISTPLNKSHWGECTANQTLCRQAPHGVNTKTTDQESDDLEANQKVTDAVLFFSRNIAVPARRNSNTPDVLAGKKVFNDIGCASCHHPSFTTPKTESQAAQQIWPYTDMLLHDMGEGLADNRSEGAANGNEWRTAPLWGIGITHTINKRAGFLHDGRARTLQEAILWHGGEAKDAKQQYTRLDKSHRQSLILFLKSL